MKSSVRAFLVLTLLVSFLLSSTPKLEAQNYEISPPENNSSGTLESETKKLTPLQDPKLITVPDKKEKSYFSLGENEGFFCEQFSFNCSTVTISILIFIGLIFAAFFLWKFLKKPTKNPDKS